MKLAEISGISPDLRAYTPHNELVLPTTIIGIEIEAEEVSRVLNGSVTRWETKEDPSLRHNGREFITPPIFGQDVVTALQEFEDLCSLSTPSFSWRTSTHIHLDVRDLDAPQLRQIMILYTLLEPYMFSYCDPVRSQSIYCLPLISAPHVIHFWGKLLTYAEQGYASEARHAISRIVKYQALNLYPIISQGSIEFRHLQGTSQKATILPWINIILSIKKAALEFPNEDWIADVSVNGMDWILNKIFTKDLISMFGNITPTQVYASARLAQDFVYYKELAELQADTGRIAAASREAKRVSGYITYRTKGKGKLPPESPQVEGATPSTGGLLAFTPAQAYSNEQLEEVLRTMHPPRIRRNMDEDEND